MVVVCCRLFVETQARLPFTCKTKGRHRLERKVHRSASATYLLKLLLQTSQDTESYTNSAGKMTVKEILLGP